MSLYNHIVFPAERAGVPYDQLTTGALRELLTTNQIAFPAKAKKAELVEIAKKELG